MLLVEFAARADSMVLAKILTKLSASHGGFQVVGVHIDYANRPESEAESQYVEQWCAHREVVKGIHTRKPSLHRHVVTAGSRRYVSLGD